MRTPTFGNFRRNSPAAVWPSSDGDGLPINPGIVLYALPFTHQSGHRLYWSRRIMAVNYTLHDPHDLNYHVHLVLSRSPYIKSRDIQFEIEGSTVVLKGAVKTYYQKQMAQHALLQIGEIGSIRNELAVIGRRPARERR